MVDAWTEEAGRRRIRIEVVPLEKPWKFRRRKSDSDKESERQSTNQTGEDPNLDRFGWTEGDLEILYDPYEEKRSKRRQQPEE